MLNIRKISVGVRGVLRQIGRRARIASYNHFELLLFCLAAPIVFIGLNLLSTFPWVSALIALLLLVAGCAYYFFYFVKHRRTTDAYTYGDYKFKVFSFWGINAFNLLFLASLALIAMVIQTLAPSIALGSDDYLGILLNLLQSALNGLLLGLVDPVVQLLEKHVLETAGVEPSTIEIIYTSIAGLIVDLAFVKSLTSELGEWNAARKEVSVILKTNHLEPEPIDAAESKKIRQMLNYIRDYPDDVESHESVMVEYLFRSEIKETKNFFLNRLEQTQDIEVVRKCLAYFETHKHLTKLNVYRLRQIYQQTNNHTKENELEKFAARNPNLKLNLGVKSQPSPQLHPSPRSHPSPQSHKGPRASTNRTKNKSKQNRQALQRPPQVAKPAAKLRPKPPNPNTHQKKPPKP